MGNPSQTPDSEREEDLFEHETVAELPSREAMSIIDPSVGLIRIPYQPPDGMADDPGVVSGPATEVEDGRLEQ